MVLFGGDGGSTDPNTGPISGEELREFFAGFFEAFPDISFEVGGLFEGGGGHAAAQWRMRTVAPRPSGSRSSLYGPSTVVELDAGHRPFLHQHAAVCGVLLSL